MDLAIYFSACWQNCVSCKFPELFNPQYFMISLSTVKQKYSDCEVAMKRFLNIREVHFKHIQNSAQ